MSETAVTRTPYLKNFINEMLYPNAREESITITLAAAPIIVALPPKHAPRARLHHSGYTFIVAESSFIKGTIVAV